MRPLSWHWLSLSDLLRGLTRRSKSSVVIRIGGGSQDRTTYEASSTAVAGTNTLGSGLWKNLNAISAASGAKWIPGLNLLAFSKATIDMAGAASDGLGSNLQSLELGNECAPSSGCTDTVAGLTCGR